MYDPSNALFLLVALVIPSMKMFIASRQNGFQKDYLAYFGIFFIFNAALKIVAPIIGKHLTLILRMTTPIILISNHLTNTVKISRAFQRKVINSHPRFERFLIDSHKSFLVAAINLFNKSNPRNED